VALARALAIDPSVVLLDEPFASLDPELRRVVREETLRVVREAQATALLVTHDAADCDGVDACVDLRV
jgi:iron(III) transport system ATP-binding protein